MSAKSALFGLLSVVLASGVCFATDKETSESLYAAIRSNDLAKLQSLLKSAGNPNLADDHGATPLMYAATAGSYEAMKLLLERGANVNARNQFGSTALMWAASDLKRIRLLVEHGADVNAASKQGRTALLLAAMNDHSAETLRYLISKGADVKAVDGLRQTALLAATAANDTEATRLLVYAGLDVNAADYTGTTPLMNAASLGNLVSIKLLLTKGANVNATSQKQSSGVVKNGPIALGSFTPLNLSVTYGPAEVVKTLLDAGANVNALDVRNMSPLMLAVTSDHHDPEVVRLLLAHKADVHVKSVAGETALDWAIKMGHKDSAIALQRAGAKTTEAHAIPEGLPAAADPRTAVTRSIALLERSTVEFFKNGGCVSCHSQNMTDAAVGLARKNGLHVDNELAGERWKMVKAIFGPAGPMLLERMDPPGSPDTTLYSLAGLAATGYTPDRMTDAMVANIVGMQSHDGGLHSGGIARAPVEDGDFSRTALAIRAIQTYGPPGRAAEMAERCERAARWLQSAHPVNAEERNMRLLGLHWAGVRGDAVRKASSEILTSQRADGGWAQRSGMPGDAYATGQSLVALAEAGEVQPGDAAYQRGVKFLVSTQRADGSWHVRSRSPKFQPYFESGFPYGHDQWISSMGTSWAAMGLAISLADTRAGGHAAIAAELP